MRNQVLDDHALDRPLSVGEISVATVAHAADKHDDGRRQDLLLDRLLNARQDTASPHLGTAAQRRCSQ